MNVISLEMFHQLTLKLIFVFILPGRWMLFFLPSAKNKMSAMLSLRCEHDTSPTISLTDSYLMS